MKNICEALPEPSIDLDSIISKSCSTEELWYFTLKIITLLHHGLTVPEEPIPFHTPVVKPVCFRNDVGDFIQPRLS